MQNDYLIYVDGNKWLVGFEYGAARYVTERPKMGLSLHSVLSLAKEYGERFKPSMMTIVRIEK